MKQPPLLLLTIVVWIVGLAGLLVSVEQMGRLSLWNDELYSIQKFSSHGLVTTLTDYHEPNNHILHNALAALFGFTDPRIPWKARGVSFLSLFGLAAWVCFYARKTGLWCEGGLALVGLGASLGLMELSLQARGYGLALFFGVFCFTSLHLYLRGEGARYVWLLGVGTVLGTWAIPPFIAYGGGLLLFLWLYTLRWQVVWCACVVLVGVACAYAPVVDELLRSSATYGEVWGCGFCSLADVAAVLKAYLLNGATSFVVVAVGAAILPVMGRRDIPFSATQIIGTLAIVTFFTVCLVLKTPPQRTAAFIGGPILLSGAIVFVTIVARYLSRFRLLQAMALLAPVVVLATKTFSYRFAPIENWLGVARCIEMIVPSDVPVYVNFRPEMLGSHLTNPGRLTEEWDAGAFARGELVHIDANFQRREPFDPSAYASFPVRFKVPQKRGQYQEISFVVGAGARVSPSLEKKRRLKSGAIVSSFRFAVTGGPTRGRFVVDLGAASRADVEALLCHRGKEKEPCPEIPVVDGALVIDLTDRDFEEVGVRLRASPQGGETKISGWFVGDRDSIQTEDLD